VSQIFHRGLEELTLGNLAIELMLPKEVKDLSEVLGMVMVIFAVDEDVIYVDNNTLVQ
jgi:hypothetical protein